MITPRADSSVLGLALFGLAAWVWALASNKAHLQRAIHANQPLVFAGFPAVDWLRHDADGRVHLGIVDERRNHPRFRS